LAITPLVFQFSKILDGRKYFDSLPLAVGLTYHFADTARVGLFCRASYDMWNERKADMYGNVEETREGAWHFAPVFGVQVGTEGLLPTTVTRWVRIHFGFARHGSYLAEVWRLGYEIEVPLLSAETHTPFYSERVHKGIQRRSSWPFLVDDGDGPKNYPALELVFLQDFEWAQRDVDSTELPPPPSEKVSAWYQRGLGFGLRATWWLGSLWAGGSYSPRFGWGGSISWDMGVLQVYFHYSERAVGFEPLAGDAEWQAW